MSDLGTRTGKPLIESDRVEGTTVYDREGNDIGSIKRLMTKSSADKWRMRSCHSADLWAWGRKSIRFPEL